MNKFYKTVAAFALCVMLAACSSSDGKVIEEPSPSPSPVPNDVMVVPPSIAPSNERPSEPIEDLYPPAWFKFELSADEQTAYDRLKAELTTDVFEGMSPISVAKVYIQAGVDGEWEAEYTCHSQVGMPMSKEDWHQQHIEDLAWSVLESRKSLADWQFALIDDGEIVIEGDEATIIYFSTPYIESEVPSTVAGEDPDIIIVEPIQEEIEATYNEFHMIKNEKDIWEVRYRPHLID